MSFSINSVIYYFPYGKVLRQYVPENPRERFLTTYHERDYETGLDYRGARFYDSDVGRFLSLDPLAVIYPGLSDYSYVAGNPILFVDPTGKKIEIEHSGYQTDEDGNHILDENGKKIRMKGYITYQRGMSRTGNAYTDAAIESLDGLIDAEADPNGIISTLAGDNSSVFINQISWDQRNGAAGGSISWSSQGGLVHDDGIGRHSPAISLLHELGHAYYQFYDPTGEIARQPIYTDHHVPLKTLQAVPR